MKNVERYLTVRIFQYFCVTQILREIKVGDCRGLKTAILTQSDYSFYEMWHFLHGWNLPKYDIQSL